MTDVATTGEDVIDRLGLDRPTVPWRTVLKRDPCVYCGNRSGDITIDHIAARSKGNLNANYKNGAPACFTCNQSKGDRSLLMFLAGIRQPKAQVLLADKLRRQAHNLLGKCPSLDWWTVVADLIKTRKLRATSIKRSHNREDATWVVPVVSTNGVDVDLRVAARTFHRQGEVYCVLLMSVSLGSRPYGVTSEP